jgi:hypothetical protein
VYAGVDQLQHVLVLRAVHYVQAPAVASYEEMRKHKSELKLERHHSSVDKHCTGTRTHLSRDQRPRLAIMSSASYLHQNQTTSGGSTLHTASHTARNGAFNAN